MGHLAAIQPAAAPLSDSCWPVQLSEGCFTDARASRRKEKRRGRAPALNAGQAGQRIGGNRAAGCKCGSMFQHRMRVLLRSECAYTHGERGEGKGTEGEQQAGPGRAGPGNSATALMHCLAGGDLVREMGRKKLRLGWHWVEHWVEGCTGEGARAARRQSKGGVKAVIYAPRSERAVRAAISSSSS